MTQAAGQDKPHYHGHRERLRDKLLQNGSDALPDYELLELVLMSAVPRRDMKPLAKRLIDRFGGYPQALAASPAELRKVDGVGDAVVSLLKVVQASAVRMAKREVMERPVLNAWHKVVDYCHTAMAHEGSEQFRLLFLDRKNKLIADEVQQQRHRRPHPGLSPRGGQAGFGARSQRP